MSNLSINQLLSQLQTVPVVRQQVADAAESDAPADQTASEAANGQDLPDAAAESAGAAANTEGSSAPVLSNDMTAVLLQLQESTEMTDARSLLYGTGSSDSSTNLFGTSSSSTDPLQAFLDQMSSTDASLTSSNQTLLDYLEGTDPTQSGASTGAGATSSNQTLLDYLEGTDPTLAGSPTSAGLTSSNQTLLDYLDATDPTQQPGATDDPLLGATSSFA